MAVQNPVHFDIVGSFLRPERLKKAREAFRSGGPRSGWPAPRGR